MRMSTTVEQTDLGVKIFAKIQPKEKDDDVKMTSLVFVRWALFVKKGA